MYLNFLKSNQVLSKDLNYKSLNNNILKKKNLIFKKKKKINIFNKSEIFLYSNKQNTKTLKLKNFKAILKIYQNFLKKDFLKKKLFKFWKKQIYIKKKSSKKKKILEKKNFKIFIKKSRHILNKKRKVFKFLFYNNYKFKKIWYCRIIKSDKEKGKIFFIARNKPKIQYWNNISIFKRNRTTLQVLKFKTFKEKKNFLESFFFKKKKIFSSNKDFINIHLSNFSKTNSFLLSFFKKIVFFKKKKSQIIFLYYNFSKLKKFFKKKNITNLKIKNYSKKLNFLKKKKKTSKIFFKTIKKLKKQKNLMAKLKNFSKIENKNFLISKKKNFLKNKKLFRSFFFKKKKSFKNFRKFRNFSLKKRKKFKNSNLIFWFFFKNSSIKKYKLKSFFKKYLIFFRFYKILILKKKKKKKKHFIKKKIFKNFFWSIESKINIFLVRIGFLKNLNQSNFFILKKSIFLNNKLITNLSTKVKINDLLQVSYFLNIFLKIYPNTFKKINFFLIQKLLKKKKTPFYLEINNNIQASYLLYKPKPINLNMNKIKKFNFYFYKYLFFFLKKKTF